MNPPRADRPAPDRWFTGCSVADRFEEQVQCNPDQIAIRLEHEEITYERLNRSANQLARVIKDRAGDSGRYVALMFDPGSWSAIAAMLAALKVGITYVPLDPAYPSRRTSYMLSHSASGLLLSDSNHVEAARKLAPDRIPVFDAESVHGTISDDNLGEAVCPETPAYVLYTSGSTGRPKGVVQTHGNLLHFVGSYARRLRITSRDRLTFFYSYSFSASLMDIYGALLHGATLLPYDLNQRGMDALAIWLARERITVFHSVPTVYRSFTAALPAGCRLPDLRVIDLGGEPVYKHDVEMFQRCFSDQCRLFNHLAFTEASVCAQHAMTRATRLSTAVAPVGIDAEGVKLLLLDESGSEVAPGEVGEIVVQSNFLSPGYWRDEELTNAAFRPVIGHAARCYFTGDMGRRWPSGLLEHVGRKDFRIKIRGHSVEVAEIEQALLAVEWIKSTVVVARPDSAGNSRLVAYFTSAGESSPSRTELRRALKDRLPDYMVPSACVRLPKLPLTATGKVDRQALPAPDWGERVSASHFVAPRNNREARLVKIWSRVLGLREVGVRDDFFELGGNSLAAFQLLSEIRRAFGVEFPVSLLAEASTIEEFASRIEDPAAGRPGTRPTPLQPWGARNPLFLVPPAGKTVLVFHDLARNIDVDQPILGLNHLGIEGDESDYRTVEAMAAEFIGAVRAVRPRGPFLLGGMCFGATVAFEMASQLRAAGEEVGTLVVLDEIPPGFKRPAANGFAQRLFRNSRRLVFHLRNGSLYVNLRRQMKRAYRKRAARQVDAVWRAHRLARLDYRPPKVDVNLSLFVTAEWKNDTEWIDGWRKLTAGATRLFEVPGGHGEYSSSFINEPYVGRWSATLARCLIDATPGSRHVSSCRPPS